MLLELLDVGLEQFFRATASLSATDVDVSFEAPDREWSAKLTRPTVNFFLWDIRRSASRSRAGMEIVEREGVKVHQPALPVVELRYVVTAWTNEHADERSLLSGLTHSLLKYGKIPKEFVPDDIAYLGEPDLLMARAGEDHVDVFKALEGQLKPGLNVVLVSKFEIDSALLAGPPVGSIGLSASRLDGGPGVERRRVAGEIAGPEGVGAIGAVVRSPVDSTYVNSTGRFLLRAEAGDEIVVEVDPPLVAVVPDTGGIRIG